jgi:DNA-binding NtrC family response regulator
MLSPDSAAMMADLLNALRATPTRDLRATLEQIIARHAGVTRVRLRPADPGTPTPEAGSEGQAPSIVPVPWRDETFLLDAEPHMRDRAEVLAVLRAAVPVAACVLCAQGNALAPVSVVAASVAGSASAPSVSASASDEAQASMRPVLESDRLVGSSVVMEGLRQEIRDSAATHFAVLIEGESGVGKELVARQIHATSSRRRGPFVPVNCAAVVESLFESELFGIEEGVATGVRARRGKFEQANHGTLFLDEIAELSLPAQAKLLRVVQDFAIERVGSQTTRRVDVRLIVATNRSLDLLVDAGQFRRDLYFRLRAIQIHVAPLRDRREDIVEIADAYLRRCDPARPPHLSRAAAGVLCLHPWPGNVRELERALEFALTRSGGEREIRPEHLAPDLGQPYRDVLLPPGAARFDESLTSMKSRYARMKYEQYKGNKRRTCAALNISYHTLVALLREGVSHVNTSRPGQPKQPGGARRPGRPGRPDRASPVSRVNQINGVRRGQAASHPDTGVP